jgi:hypothetical protein
MSGLTDRLNWNLLVRTKLTAFKKPDTTLFYRPIRYTLTPTTKVLVGVANSKAKPTWRYGGHCRIYISASPSYTSQFTSQMIVLDKALSLGKLNFIELPNLEVENYSIELLPPKWFEEFAYEIWWYDGGLIGQDADIEAIRDDVAAIKAAIIPPT